MQVCQASFFGHKKTFNLMLWNSLSSCLYQVSVIGQTAEGMGPSKKVAKRNAAEKMLELLGFKVPQPQPPKPALKTEEKVHSQTFMCFYLCVRFLPTSNTE